MERSLSVWEELERSGRRVRCEVYLCSNDIYQTTTQCDSSEKNGPDLSCVEERCAQWRRRLRVSPAWPARCSCRQNDPRRDSPLASGRRSRFLRLDPKLPHEKCEERFSSVEEPVSGSFFAAGLLTLVTIIYSFLRSFALLSLSLQLSSPPWLLEPNWTTDLTWLVFYLSNNFQGLFLTDSY